MSGIILVPLDGSVLAERAVPYAHTLAAAMEAEILLVRAVEVSSTRDARRGGDLAERTREARTYLDEIAARLGNLVRVETVVLAGDPTTAILGEIERKHVSLLVMSTHGMAGIGRWIYGSVADQVIRQTDLPILLIPAHCQLRWTDTQPHRIVVPLDGSSFAEEALGPASDLAQALGAEIVLMHVIVPPTYTYADVTSYVYYDPSDDRAEACRLLEDVAYGLRVRGIRTAIHDAVGFPAMAIAEATSKLGGTLIAMSTHGRGGVSRRLMGSVATGVIQRATAPVLIVRPRQIRRHQKDSLLAVASGQPGQDR